MTNKLSPALLCCAVLIATGVSAQTSPARNPSVGGAEMLASKTIMANAAAALNLKTLVAAVRAAGLSETLAGAGPFTVFAPTDAAFGQLPAGTIDTLLKPENKATLAKVLAYHVVVGTLTAENLATRIIAGRGSTVLTTIEGEQLTASMEGNAILLTDVNGNKSRVQTADVRQSNGIVHVIDGVMLPKLN